MMNQDVLKNRELVSTLADGQLRGGEFARAVGIVCGGGEARATWHAYHVVGDVLRSGELAACAGDAAFLARFQSRLNREIASTHPLLAKAESATYNIANNADYTRARSIIGSSIGSANESSFGWKLVAGFASLAAVGAISWSLAGGTASPGGAGPSPPQLAQATPPFGVAPGGATPVLVQQDVSVNGLGPQVMIRDPHLDALLAAHNQFGGTSALQMSAGFLRNATFEGAAR